MRIEPPEAEGEAVRRRFGHPVECQINVTAKRGVGRGHAFNGRRPCHRRVGDGDLDVIGQAKDAQETLAVAPGVDVDRDHVAGRRLEQRSGRQFVALVDDPEQRHRVLETSGRDEVGEVTGPEIGCMDPEQIEGRRVRRIDPAGPRDVDARQARLLPPGAGHRGTPAALAVHVPGRRLAGKVPAAHDRSRKQPSQSPLKRFGAVQRVAGPEPIDVPAKGGIRARNRDDAKGV
jgi:hypothetical protein